MSCFLPIRRVEVFAALLLLWTAELSAQGVGTPRRSGEITSSFPDSGLTSPCWRLSPAAHAGGPGRWELTEEGQCETPRAWREAGEDPNGQTRTTTRPAVRQGDALLIEQHSEVADIYLHGVALSSAAHGQTIHARVLASGALVRVLVSKSGHARLASLRAGQP